MDVYARRRLPDRSQDLAVALRAVRPMLVRQQRRADAFRLPELLLEDRTDYLQPFFSTGSGMGAAA